MGSHHASIMGLHVVACARVAAAVFCIVLSHAVTTLSYAHGVARGASRCTAVPAEPTAELLVGAALCRLAKKELGRLLTTHEIAILSSELGARQAAVSSVFPARSAVLRPRLA